MTTPLDRPVRVALDLLGGDHAPGAVVQAARLLAELRPDIELVLVGPADLAAESLGDVAGRRLVAASDAVGMGEDPGHAVRRKPHSSIRVAMDLLASGDADALVSAGSTGATIAAAHLVLGRHASVSRSVLAAVIPGLANPVVVLDVGGSLTTSADVLGELAIHGAAYSAIRFGVDRPRVGLLSIGVEPGKGDSLRRAAFHAVEAALRGAPAVWHGNVEGSDVPLGTVDVVVTDGFTGNVLLKGLEGALALFRATVSRAVPAVADSVGEAIEPLRPDGQGGARLLGVPGVIVVGHGASSAEAIVSCVELAAVAAAESWVPRVTARAATPVINDSVTHETVTHETGDDTPVPAVASL
ncbi:MAG: phosphate acyltransferase PlsX [Frankiales bacterium]|nr:phosphate acyltransferase PlsX [Frankiales bacterium]